MSVILRKITRMPGCGYLAGALGTAVVTLAFLPLQQHLRSTPGLLLIVVIVLVATHWGSRPAFFTSLLAIAALDVFFIPPFRFYFFMPPLHFVDLREVRYGLTFVAFVITSIVVGQLSGRARQRARDAEEAKVEVERLYNELQSAFGRASHAQALRQSEKFKSALLDAVTHDLRTPLTSIRVSATTLLRHKLDGGQDEAVRELLSIIDQESNRLDRLIDNLVLMARIEARQFTVRPFASSVSEIVAHAVQRMEADNQGLSIQTDLAGDLPPVEADSRAVAQVVYTLLENACKYGLAGKPITVTACRGGDSEIRFAVENEGPRIPPELRERVFDKFYRASEDVFFPASKAAQPRGTGMGLFIAHAIVEAHQGKIWIEDAQSRPGTRVSFTVPVSRWSRRQPDYSI